MTTGATAEGPTISKSAVRTVGICSHINEPSKGSAGRPRLVSIAPSDALALRLVDYGRCHRRITAWASAARKPTRAQYPQVNAMELSRPWGCRPRPSRLWARPGAFPPPCCPRSEHSRLRRLLNPVDQPGIFPIHHACDQRLTGSRRPGSELRRLCPEQARGLPWLISASCRLRRSGLRRACNGSRKLSANWPARTKPRRQKSSVAARCTGFRYERFLPNRPQPESARWDDRLQPSSCQCGTKANTGVLP